MRKNRNRVVDHNNMFIACLDSCLSVRCYVLMYFYRGIYEAGVWKFYCDSV